MASLPPALRLHVLVVALTLTSCASSDAQSSRAPTATAAPATSVAAAVTPDDACVTAARSMESGRSNDARPFRAAARAMGDLKKVLDSDDEFRSLTPAVHTLRSRFINLGSSEAMSGVPMLAWGLVALIRLEAAELGSGGCADVADEAAALLATHALPVAVDDLAASCRRALLEGQYRVPSKVFEQDSFSLLSMASAAVAFQTWLGVLEQSVYAAETSGGLPADGLESVRDALGATTEAFNRWDRALAARILGDGSTAGEDEAERATFEQLALLEGSLDDAEANCVSS